MGFATQFVYILFAALLIFEPYVIKDDLWFLSQRGATSLVNAIVLVLAYVLFVFVKRDMRRKDQETEAAEKRLNSFRGTLNDAFAYIGILNRRLPIMKSMTTDLLVHTPSTKKEKRRVFQELLDTAIGSIVKTEWGVLRFVRVDRQQTVQEFIFGDGTHPPVSNQLLTSQPPELMGAKHVDGVWCVGASERNSPVRCFLVFPHFERIDDKDDMVLQSIVDQAQIFYTYLDRLPGGNANDAVDDSGVEAEHLLA